MIHKGKITEVKIGDSVLERNETRTDSLDQRTKGLSKLLGVKAST